MAAGLSGQIDTKKGDLKFGGGHSREITKDLEGKNVGSNSIV